MANKTSSKTQQNNYASYKSQGRQAANRKRKLLKLQKEQPNNLQIAEALKNIKYRRKTPGSALWSKTKIEMVKLFKEFSKGVDTIGKTSDKWFFSLGTRAHSKGENLCWKF